LTGASTVSSPGSRFAATSRAGHPRTRGDWRQLLPPTLAVLALGESANVGLRAVPAPSELAPGLAPDGTLVLRFAPVDVISVHLVLEYGIEIVHVPESGDDGVGLGLSEHRGISSAPHRRLTSIYLRRAGDRRNPRSTQGCILFADQPFLARFRAGRA